jgi:NAD(P)-dependent dehydrogenase (short-subunit alcohol dehydrogenase family)
MQDFAGKVAVVTGAASGIGLGLATRFAQEGMKVVLADVEQPALDAAVTRLRQQEFDVLGVVTDVSSADAVEDLAQRTLDAYGKVHILCNNAGVGGGAAAAIWEATLKDWRWALGVNLLGVIHGLHAFVPLMLEHGEEGHIVNTASGAGLVPANRVYSVTKHAVVALSEALYYDLKRVDAKVGASVLCPGIVNTRIMYSGRNRPPELQNVPGAPLSEVERARSDRVHALAEAEGMDPAELAGIVVEAIKNDQFYILTHGDYDNDIRQRMENILARGNPAPFRSLLERPRSS